MTTKHAPATPLPWNDTEFTLTSDAGYIAHAANAYPKLVEALRKAIRELRIENVNADGEQKPNTPIAIVNEDFAALLRSLGEE